MGVLNPRNQLWPLSVAIYLYIACTGKRAMAQEQTKVPLVVVVAEESELYSLSLRELRRVYSGDNHDRNRRPFNRSPQSSERVAFDRKVLGLSPSQMGRYWIDRKIRGQGGSPRSLTSALLVAKVVKRFPGAIGYMRADQVPPWVRALRINGKMYNDEGYPLWVDTKK